jgi:hypothetical protein
MERQGDCLTSKGEEGLPEFSFSDSHTTPSYLYLTLYPILTLNLYLSVCVCGSDGYDNEGPVRTQTGPYGKGGQGGQRVTALRSI